MEKNRQLSRFVSQRGNPIDLIVSESQLQRFLSQEWREKSKRIAGENGLTIEHTTGYWHFNFMRRGRRYHKTLGRYPCVSLQQAREICREIREAIIAGRAESAVSQVRKNEQPAKLIHKKTIDSLVSDYFIYRLNSLKETGTNKAPVKAVHRMQNLYESYLSEVLGDLEPKAVKNSHVIRALSGITHSETTRKKTKSELSLMMKWFVASGYIDADELHLDWGLINASLVPCNSVRKNYPRLSIEDVPRFVADLVRKHATDYETITTYATLLFLLTAQRVGNFLDYDQPLVGVTASRFSTWADVDFDRKIWTIQPECMKVTQSRNNLVRPLRIPLSNQTIDVLKSIREFWLVRGVRLTEKSFVVPKFDNSQRPHKSYSIRKLIRQLHQEAIAQGNRGYFDPDQPNKIATTHGFRSTFQDWCVSQGYSSIYVDKALAHIEESSVRRAYQRSDFVEERRDMMQAWATYCFSKTKLK